jgi:hypothetical protein
MDPEHAEPAGMVILLIVGGNAIPAYHRPMAGVDTTMY